MSLPSMLATTSACAARISSPGRVTSLQGSRIILEDHGDGPSSIELADAFLENRKENLVWCSERLLGSKAAKVLNAADHTASKHVSGPGRLEHTRRMFDYLRRQEIELAPGAYLALAHFTEEAASKGELEFRKRGDQKADPGL